MNHCVHIWITGAALRLSKSVRNLIIHKCHTCAHDSAFSANLAPKSDSWCLFFICGHFPLECSKIVQQNVAVGLNWHAVVVGSNTPQNEISFFF